MKNAASQTLLTLLSAGVLAIGSGCASTEMNTNKEPESDMAVPAASPVEVDETEARGVLARLGPSGTFMGILLSPGRTLQPYFNPDATVLAEVL